MPSVKEINLFSEVIKEFNYSFGNLYVFKNFVVSEMNQGENIAWDNGKLMIDDITSYFDTNGEDIILISNRIHSYSVVAADWLKFFKQKYSLKAYCIVSANEAGTLNSAIEKLFFKKKIKHFKTLEEAVNFVKKNIIEITN